MTAASAATLTGLLMLVWLAFETSHQEAAIVASGGELEPMTGLEVLAGVAGSTLATVGAFIGVIVFVAWKERRQPAYLRAWSA